ncbi:MAG: helix-turn-helix domain-containing protein [bacterium]|nr:helix-turn-helix domain-containing protein [bacterium]
MLAQRVRDEGMPVAHIAKAMGVSRQWIHRFDIEGEAGLQDRSSRPHSIPRETSPNIEDSVVAARLEHRRGPEWLFHGRLACRAARLQRICDARDCRGWGCQVG